MKNRAFNDSLFIFQISFALLFGFFQIKQMLFVSVEGLSISTYLFTTLFVGVNTFFSFQANKVLTNRIAIQNLIIYILGTLIYLLFSLILILKSTWSFNDSQTLFFVVTASIIVILKNKKNGLKITDPVLKSDLGIIFRAIPHCFMAYKIFVEGGGGLSVFMVIIFHILTLTRIILIYSSYLKLKTDINRKSILRTEIWNEVSWIIVTLAWLIKT